MMSTDQTTTALLAGALALGMACAVGACSTDDHTETKIVVPSAATSTPEYERDGSVPDQRYVIRMSDGERDWEVEFPEVATGYEMHIPLGEKRSRSAIDDMRWESDTLTEADKEILREKRRNNPEMTREGVYHEGTNAATPPESGSGQAPGSGEPTGGQQQSGQKQDPRRPRLEARQKEGASGSGQSKQRQRERSGTEPAPHRPSYLLGIQEVRQLYKSGDYEIAMVRLKKLQEAYPNDEKILSMKGTLLVKLGLPTQARKVWERVLKMNEDNDRVRRALQRLNKRLESSSDRSGGPTGGTTGSE